MLAFRNVAISRSILLALLLLPVIRAQRTDSSADRTVAVPAAGTTAPATPENLVVHTLMGWIGPAEPAPLTPKQKFELYLLNTGGPVPLIGETFGAGYGQLTNTPHEYGQGWEGFGKRYGANLAYNATRQTISYATSLVFHEDTRYFASRDGGVWKRAGHALLSTFTARKPGGRDTFSVSSVAGVVGACSISSIWGPPSWKGAGNIAYNAGISFSATAGFNLVREFLPDILRRPRK